MLRALFVFVLLSLLALPPALADPAPANSAPTVDLLPLKKAMVPLSGSGTVQTHTTIHSSFVQAGLSVVLQEDLQILSLRPGHFRTIVTQYTPQGQPLKRLIVTSNGTTVWTYRPGLNQYSVSSAAAFRKADSDVPTLGLIIGGFYLGDGYPMIQGFLGITPENSAAVLKALNGVDVALSEHAASVAGQDDYVYEMVLAKENLTYHFYVSSASDTLKRIDLTSNAHGINITYREDVIEAAAGPLPVKSTFSFVPPPGAKKVPLVSADPF